MKKNFEKPVYEVISFHSNIITTSSCGCNIGGIDIGGCDENTCSGVNLACTCNPNYTDPNANCTTPKS